MTATTASSVDGAWAEGAAYEAYIGRWSRLVAQAFLAWLDAPPLARWLDVGCGSGALTDAVLAGCSPAAVLSLDRSAAFARYVARTSAPATARSGTTASLVGDAAALPLGADAVDVAASGLVLNFLPSPENAVAELARVVRPGGVVAVYVWDYADGMRLLREFWDTAASLDPAAARLDEGLRFPLCGREPLRALLADAGLREVEVTGIEVPTRFRDFDDVWRPFLGGQGPAPGYVASLPDLQRDELREALRARLPVAADGSIALTARAWAARGCA